MNSYAPHPLAPAFVRNIALDLVLTLVTFGLFNLFVQYQQMRAVNQMIGEKRYRFVHWLLFTIITFGLYHIYHEYRKSVDIARANGETNTQEGLVSALLTAFGCPFVADAIQQFHINKYFGDSKL